MSHKKIILDALEEVSKSDTFKEVFKEYNLDEKELWLVPICFKSDLEVSARTEHGIIYLNERLCKMPDKIPNYIIHELTHFCQQTTGDQPTQGSTDDSYLDNPYEIEGFNNQTKYIAETDGDEKAKQYIEKVLNHHQVPKEEKEEKRKELLSLNNDKQLSLFPKQKQENLTRKDFLENLAKLVKDLEDPEQLDFPKKYIKKEKLHPEETKYRLKKLKDLLDAIKDQ